MRYFKIVSLVVPVLAYGVGVAAHFDWVQDGLDNCWQRCLEGNGCSSQKCICDASANESYLPNSIQCVKSKCDTAGWLEVGLLAPLQVYCAGSGDAIPKSIMDEAYECATATAGAAPTTTHKPEHSTTTATTQGGGKGLEGTTTSTFTQTTTDGDGHTVAVIVPIVMGPDTMFTGSSVVSTIKPTTTAALISTDTTQTAAPTSADATHARGASSSAPPAQATQVGPAGGNGSPFENMQAAATRFGFTTTVVGLGLFAGLFLVR